MRVEAPTALVPTDRVLMPITGARKQELGYLPNNNTRSKSELTFLGYGVRGDSHIYGPSGRDLRTQKTNGALVDLYV